MNTYIIDRNGNRYDFKKLPLKKTLEIQNRLVKNNENVEVVFDIFKEIFMTQNPTYDISNFDNDILEYNYEELGLTKLIELINAITEEVFQLKETNTTLKYAFLQKE